MARIRSIKPEFWSSEQVMACSTNARLLFIGLWNFCDDAGRHPVTPRQIKALVFPADDISSENVRVLLDELSTNGLITFYTVEGKEYFQVTGWQHQKIDRPQSPKYPAPVVDHSSSARDGEDEGRDKGEEGKGEERGGADAPTAGFAFVGKVVRLKIADFDKWRQSYSAIPDLIAELTKADDYYAENPPEGGKWYFPVSSWLERTHREASKATGTHGGAVILDKHGNRPGDPYYGVDY